jgi:hypothetical protein
MIKAIQISTTQKTARGASARRSGHLLRPSLLSAYVIGVHRRASACIGGQMGFGSRLFMSHARGELHGLDDFGIGRAAAQVP